jgi:hypothetical protein
VHPNVQVPATEFEMGKILVMLFQYFPYRRHIQIHKSDQMQQPGGEASVFVRQLPQRVETRWDTDNDNVHPTRRL